MTNEDIKNSLTTDAWKIDTSLTIKEVFQSVSERVTKVIEERNSAKDALWAIANMQVTEHTDKDEVLELCMSIARLELEKGS